MVASLSTRSPAGISERADPPPAGGRSESATAGLPEADAVRRICCLMLADIGDVMVTTPALELLRRRYPDARISVVLRSTMARLLAGNPNVDSLILYRPDGFLKKIRLLLRLIFEKVDLWVDLHTPTFNTVCSNDRVFRRNDLLKRFCRPRNSVGFALAGGGKHTHRVPMPDGSTLASENIVLTTARIVGARPYAADAEIPGKYFHVFAEEAQWARDQVPAIAARHGPLLGLFFGSNQPADVWPVRHCIAWIQLTLARIEDAQIVILGGPGEEGQAIRIMQALTPGQRRTVTNLTNRATLGQTGAVLSHCDAFVTTDSGPLHIADARRVPLVALYSSKNYPAIWSPWQSRARILNVPVACGPCFRSECPEALPCIERISPEQVAVAVDELLKEPIENPSRVF